MLSKNTWHTHEAKNAFSRLLDKAQTETQIILRYGKPVAVILSYECYTEGIQNTGTAWDFFRTIELDGDLALPPRTEIMREVEL